MVVTSLATTLPAELIMLVMDELGLPHLLILSHVCSRWNALAHVHPYFRQYIHLSAVSTTALDFFQARLGFGTRCSVSIFLRLHDHLLCSRVRRIIFPAIVRNMFRLAHLEVNVHVDAASLALDALHHPAPLLKSLQLHFSNCSKRLRAPVLPPALLATWSPLLREVSLAGLELPAEHIFAFRHVKDLWFTLPGRRTVPADLFAHFPALQNLSLWGESCSGFADRKGNALGLALPPLAQLALRLASRDYAAVLAAIRNCRALRHIMCREPSAAVASELVGHLGVSDDVELGFRYLSNRTAHIVLVAPSTGRIRTFVDRTLGEPLRVHEPTAYGALRTPDFLARVTTLRLPAHAILLVPPETPALVFPHCRLLVLDLAFASLDADSHLRLSLPALRLVEANTGEEEFTNCLAVDGARLHAFLVRILGGEGSVRPRAALRVRDIMLECDCAALARDFEVLAVDKCPLSPPDRLRRTMPTTFS